MQRFYYKMRQLLQNATFIANCDRISNSIDIYTVAIKNIGNMHAVSTNQTADILHFNDKVH